MGNFLTWLFGKKQSKEETSSTIPVTEENNPLPIVTAAEPDTITTTGPEPIMEKESDAPIIEVDYSSLPPYEPSLDLRDYQYPLLQLLDEPLKKVFAKLVDTTIQLPLIWSVNKTDTKIRDLAELQSILIGGAPGSGKN
ncbi:MAG TPA: hypothetical protein VJU78_13055 [Chitinophagaceae bacterium]|nr:hypothetical protein [Chitinophagaceae bacterium]